MITRSQVEKIAERGAFTCLADLAVHKQRVYELAVGDGSYPYIG